MSPREARDILDAVRAGAVHPARAINAALRATGDLPPATTTTPKPSRAERGRVVVGGFVRPLLPAMRITDARFLIPHPRTLLWWEQRRECLRCANCVRVDGGGAMSCLRMPAAGDRTCLSARDSICGPEARLFAATEAVA